MDGLARRIFDRLLRRHFVDLKRWSPQERREFLLKLGAIDEAGLLTEEFGGPQSWGGLGK